MTTPVKRAATVRSKPAAKAASPKATPSKPYLRFYHPDALRVRTLKVLEAVENSADPTAHSNALTDLILALVDSGLDYYFLRSLKATEAGFVAQQSASLGLVGVQKVMGTVIRNVLGRMSGPQLLSVCASIRELME